LAEDEAYGFDVSLDGAGLRNLFNSLVVDYCTIVLGHDEEQCQEKPKGCGINDDCGFHECMDMPDSDKGYECGSPEDACDMSASTIKSCRMDIESPWVINQDTVLTNVAIECSTTGRGCIYIAHGTHVSILYSTARGDGNSRFIEMATESHLTLKNVGVSGFDAGDEDGGAIFAIEQNVVKITNSEFKLNKAADGGALYMRRFGVLTITGTKFVHNEATKRGGAATILKTQLAIDNTLFKRNVASMGGGVLIQSCTGSVRNSKFQQNSAIRFAGGMLIFGGKGAESTNNIETIHNVTFQGNFADEITDSSDDIEYNGVAGGLALVKTATTITQSSFIGNTCITRGGGLFVDGEEGDLVTSTNNIFYNNNNEAEIATQIHCRSGKLDISPNTVERVLSQISHITGECTITYNQK